MSADGSHILMAGHQSEYCTVFEYAIRFRLPLHPRLAGEPLRAGERRRHPGSDQRRAGLLRGNVTRRQQGVLHHDRPAVAGGRRHEQRYVPVRRERTNDAVSQEGSLGNTDECSADLDRKMRGGGPSLPNGSPGPKCFDTTARTPGLDDLLANQSGDIYFYSPEDLAAGRSGRRRSSGISTCIHDGHLHLVTTLRSGHPSRTRARSRGDGATPRS